MSDHTPLGTGRRTAESAKFTAVHIEQGLLSSELLIQVASGSPELPGARPADYWLGSRGNLGEAASTQWAVLKSAYRSFRELLVVHPLKKQSAQAVQDDWLLLLFQALGYGMLPRAGKLTAKARPGQTWEVSHRYGDHLPVQLLAWDTDLDRGIAGAKRAPQSLLQDFLNSSDRHLWGLLSNGKVLRLLRDSTALVGAAYVEFDLEEIFEEELYADFVLLFALLHASRFELVAKPEKKRRGGKAADATTGVDLLAAPGAEDAETGEDEDADEDEEADGEFELGEADGESEEREVPAASSGLPLTPADCRMEWWRTHALETGTRARDRLRSQVEKAIAALGTGFLRSNRHLTAALAEHGRPALDEFHHELLRLIYQFIFLCVAEDRDALLDSRETKAMRLARKNYENYFSTSRLRRIAGRRAGDRNTDLWPGLTFVLDRLGTEGGCPELALPELGGLYFRQEGVEDDDRSRKGLIQAGLLTRLLGGDEPLRSSVLTNEYLLRAVHLLTWTVGADGRVQRVDYRHLDSEELGSIYESLLELIPRYSSQSGEFWLQNLAGNKRKGTGSYYTPTSVIEKLLDNALDPVIDRFAQRGVPDDLLRIKLVDPACGSGHVLVAAARRIARRYVEMETGFDEPTPAKVREAMGKVVRNCIHGVDINPLAAELAKVSLWLETLVPGEPLAYLDDRIKVGNGLLGATPTRLALGLPDGAFEALAGDDARTLRDLKAANKKERPSNRGDVQEALLDPLVRVGTAELRVKADRLAKLPGRTLAQVREQARSYRKFAADQELTLAKRLADAWCAAFLWRKHPAAPPAITSATLRDIERKGMLPGLPPPSAQEIAERGYPETVLEIRERERAGEEELEALAGRNQFFHWHLEFPRVFRVEDDRAKDQNPATGWQGGFDAVLGNPPWDRVKIQQKEWFAARDEEVADAPNTAARTRLINALSESEDGADRQLFGQWETAKREAAGTTRMLRVSGLFPLAGRGDVNLYAVFAEQAQTLLAPEGMSGLVVPTGVATDMTTAEFFSTLVEQGRLTAVLDMENEEKLFPAVTNRYRFCLFIAGRPLRPLKSVRLAFQARRPDQLDDREFRLDAEGFRAINPNTRTSPVCESPEHARVLRGIHERVPVLWERSPREINEWGLFPLRMFDMSTDSKKFRSSERLSRDGWKRTSSVYSKGEDRFLPLYEGKHVHQFDSRFATYEGATQAQINKGTLPRLTTQDHGDPSRLPLPRYWVSEEAVDAELAANAKKKKPGWTHDWVMGWRDICRASDERTVIAAVLPRAAIGHKLPVLLSKERPELLIANLNSRVLDYAARQKYSGASLSYFIVEQLPVLPPSTYEDSAPWLAGVPLDSWIRDRVVELTYTGYDMAPFARYLGDTGGPFIWDEDRRFLIRAELDAAYFHLYGIQSEDLDLILDSFRAFRNRSPELFKKTRDHIHRVYAAMADCATAGKLYTDPALTPPPGNGPRHPVGSVPLTRAHRTEPANPSVSSVPAAFTTDEPADGALFGLDEIGGDEQLGLWG
ncbi:Eco57I restriction-modification methylase domain-containing protein [Kitasatospora sp. NPDC057738]|uniref:Eco57I restriction-modification methylase domain-containing protein n=1 Tax=Kitasatospora sp. NPDC057738 TaxID=3346233 RepID=UPI00367D2123